MEKTTKLCKKDHNLKSIPRINVKEGCAPDQGGKWRDSLDGNYEKKTTTFSLLLLKVPKDFDEITQGLQDSEAFFLSLL